ncbi:putative DD41D transposase [Trichonephila clavipes]|nr:putative DD41D transposase [Trichonephila clavipes]
MTSVPTIFAPENLSTPVHEAGVLPLSHRSRLMTHKSLFYKFPGQKRHLLTNYVASLKTCNEAHFWLNGYVNKQNCRIWSKTNPQVYVETPLHPEKLTIWCALWAGGVLQKR